MDKRNAIIFLVILILVLNLGFIIYVLSVGKISGFFLLEQNDIGTPSDFFREENIVAFENRIVLNVENPILVKFENSGSMKPTFSEFAIGVSVKPHSSDEINVGDIIFFKDGSNEIVHRVVEKGIDSEGVYFITKGDANNWADGKLRFDDVEGIIVAIIY